MKLSMKDLENITPVGVDVELKYEEEYAGEEKEVSLRVYPLTVRERLEIQALNDKLSKLTKIKEDDRTVEQAAELSDVNEQINLKYAFFAVRKNIPDITVEFLKEKFPRKWFQEIFYATLKAEGVKLDDIEKEKN